MLTKTSLVVFFIFLGQLGYIVMSDSRKNLNRYFLKKRRRFTPFFGPKSEKTYKKYFLHQPVLVRNGFLNRGPFVEVESTIRPLPLVRLIKSVVAPLLNGLFYESQYGFRKRPSTEFAALELVDKLLTMMDK